MVVEPREAPSVLIRAFLDTSRDALDFLGGQPGFQSVTTVEELRGDRIVPVAVDAVTGFFWVRRTFETNRLSGDIRLGERELEVNLLVNLKPPVRGTFG